MASKKSVQAWFEKANEDLFSLHWLHDSKNPKSFIPIAFHCQQVIEKAIKGFLTEHGKRFTKIHNLEVFFGFAIEIDPSLNEILKPTLKLTPYADTFRYPEVAPSRKLTLSDVDEFVALTVKTYKEILSRIPHDMSRFDDE